MILKMGLQSREKFNELEGYLRNWKDQKEFSPASFWCRAEKIPQTRVKLPAHRAILPGKDNHFDIVPP